MKIYRLEFENALGPHHQCKLKKYHEYSIFLDVTDNYSPLMYYYSNIKTWTENNKYVFDITNFICGFNNQNDLLEYIYPAFELFMNNGGKIFEMEVDDCYCFVTPDNQVFFVREKVKEVRIIL